MANERKTGMRMPGGILQPTATPTQPERDREPETIAAEGRGVDDAPAIAEAPESAAAPEGTGQGDRKRRRTRKALPAASDAGSNGNVEGRRLYLSEGVHFRLRIYAYQRGVKLSEAAEELLDKALPKWDISRVG